MLEFSVFVNANILFSALFSSLLNNAGLYHYRYASAQKHCDSYRSVQCFVIILKFDAAIQITSLPSRGTEMVLKTEREGEVIGLLLQIKIVDFSCFTEITLFACLHFKYCFEITEC